MNILPHHIAATFLLGGLTVGGYFTFNALTPLSLEDKLKSLNLELASTGWNEKAKEYKKKENNNLISSIDKTKSDNEVEEALKKWCEKKKGKYFLGNTDPNYKNFSIWCTVTKTIKDVLNKRNLKVLDDNGWTSKFTAYGALADNDKFVEPKKNATLDDLKKWCTDKQNEVKYTYEGDETLIKILSWCYANS